MEFTSAAGEQRYDALVRAAEEVVVGLDYDGTLAPIVDDPEAAHIHPGAPGLLVDLAREVRAVAVVTGRPARQVVALGGLDEVAESIGGDGHDLHVFGQYGHETWHASERRIVSPRPAPGLASFLGELPGLLRRVDAVGAFVEEKGLGVAVHTRRMPDAEQVFERLLPVLSEAARAHGLAVEPGRRVVEVRSPGVHKGRVVEELADRTGARGFAFVGDDLGDVEAFEAVARLRQAGLDTLLVCSGSDEQGALRELADVVVDGPTGVLALLTTYVGDVRSRR